MRTIGDAVADSVSIVLSKYVFINLSDIIIPVLQVLPEDIFIFRVLVQAFDKAFMLFLL